MTLSPHPSHVTFYIFYSISNKYIDYCLRERNFKGFQKISSDMKVFQQFSRDLNVFPRAKKYFEELQNFHEIQQDFKIFSRIA